jgi:hypothetical protein
LKNGLITSLQKELQEKDNDRGQVEITLSSKLQEIDRRVEVKGIYTVFESLTASI